VLGGPAIGTVTPLHRRPNARSTGSLGALAESYRLSLEAQNKSPRTIQTYLEAVARLETFLVAADLPADVDRIERRHVEAFIADLLETQSAATASNRYRALQSFFRWAEEEEEVERSPMAKMKPPTVPIRPVPVLRDEQLAALFKACEGSEFADLRDAAIIRLLLDTGLRRAELGALAVDDVDLRGKSVRVVGKGRKIRDAVFGAKTARALDRYVRRARTRHRDADSPALWLGHAGPMTDNGIYQAILERAKRAGLEGIHPHQFRHTWAHLLSSEGMPESQLMHLAGWSSTQMAQRYGASAVGERARATYRRMSPVDRL
jgi:site-specific recombinase XerD